MMTKSLGLHDAERRIEKAIQFAADYGTTDGAHHKMWVIDQMVRALTGCPMITKQATSYKGVQYEFEDQGESDEYKAFLPADDEMEWDEGIAP